LRIKEQETHLILPEHDDDNDDDESDHRVILIHEASGEIFGVAWETREISVWPLPRWRFEPVAS